jgi:hypothetical protein
VAISTDNVVFDREPLKVDRLWAVVATHPSGQQEHIVGFHTAAEAREWRATYSCEAWLRTRGYAGWQLRELGRSDAWRKRKAPARETLA